MSVVIRLIYCGIAIGAAAGMGAVAVFEWEPSNHLLAMVAFTALLFSTNARHEQTSDHRDAGVPDAKG